MQVRCPNCHDSTEVDDTTELSAITCASCGSAFSLVGDHTLTYTENEARTIGHFELVDEIGVGAFGSVWMARDTDLDRTVAVKIPRKGQLDPQEAEQFLREARAAAQLKHPNIVAVHEVGREDGQVYIVSDYVEGLTLADWLADQQLASRTAAALCVTLAEALHHAHEAGVIHRDLKPTNIILDRDNEPHIMDFGLAKREAGEVTMTMEGKILGTPAYMSPEQAMGEAHQADRRSDVYSLGVILYELLTGHKPFRGNVRMLIQQVINDDPPSPRKLNSSIPRDLETLCLKCLEKDSHKRYSTSKDLAEDLRRFLRGEPIHARPVTAPARAWRWCKRKPAAAVVVLLLAFLAPTVLGLLGTVAAYRRANSEADRADANSRQLEQQLQVSHANQLAARSLSMQRHMPVRGLLLAIEAVEATGREDSRNRPIVYEALLSAVATVGGRPLIGHKERIYDLAISGDGRWLVTVGGRHETAEAMVWDLQADDPGATSRALLGHQNPIMGVVTSLDGRWAITQAKRETAVRVWDLKANDLNESCRELHGRSIPRSIAISPDSRRVVIGYSNGTASLWDLDSDDTNLPLRVLEGHDGWVVSRFVDDRTLVTCDRSAMRMWNLAENDPVASSRVLYRGDLNIGDREIAVGPDGRWLAIVRSNESVLLWDLALKEATPSHSVLHQKAAHEPSIAISDDGRWLAAACDDATALVWDLTADDPASSQTVLRGHDGEIQHLAISPGGRWLATGSFDNTTRIWDLASSNLALSAIVLRGHEDTVGSVAIGPNRRWAVSGGWDGVARIWDLKSENPGSSLIVRSDQPVDSVMVSPDGRSLVTVSSDTARVWDLTADAPASSSRVLRGHEGSINEVAISPDGRWAITGGDDSTSRVWDLAADEPTVSHQILRGHRDKIESLIISPNGNWLVTGGGDGVVRVWDLANDGSFRIELPVVRGSRVRALGISADGRWLVTGASKEVRVWDLESDNASESSQLLHQHEGGVNSVAISPNGRWLLTGAGDYTPRLFRDFTPKVQLATSLPLTGHRLFIPAVAISADGRWAITGSWDSTARAWDLGSANPTIGSQILVGHAAAIVTVTVSPNSKYVVTAGEDATARVWPLGTIDSASSPLVLRGHTATIRSVAVSPDSRWVITGSLDKTARLWDLNVDSLLERARRLAGRELTPEERKQFSIDQ